MPSSPPSSPFAERIERVLHRVLHLDARLEDPEVAGDARTTPPATRSTGSRQQLVSLDPDRIPRLDHLDGRVPGVPVADEDERGSVVIGASARPSGMDVGEHEGRAVARIHAVEVDSEDLIAPGGGAIGKDRRQRADHELDQSDPDVAVRVDRCRTFRAHEETGCHVEVEDAHVPFVPDLVAERAAPSSAQRTSHLAPGIVDRSGRGRRSCRRSALLRCVPEMSICTATRRRRVRSIPSWSSSTLASYRPSGSAAIRARIPASVRRMIRSVASITTSAPNRSQSRSHTLRPSTAGGELRREIAAHQIGDPDVRHGSAPSDPRSALRRGTDAGA